jgi:predicted secreted hydrolase
MRISAAVAALAAVTVVFAAEPRYRPALPGYRYEFPRDHFNHPEFQTEWWYYTGNVHTKEGRRFGFELTFFRRAVDRRSQANVWDVEDVWLAHLALSDIDGRRFLNTERLNRPGAGLAGADLARPRIWNGNWFAQFTGEGQKLEAVTEHFGFSLSLRPQKPPVIHGVDGISRKAAGLGRASHYISFTRLAAHGTIRAGGRDFNVEGLAWMDHEFFTHQLETNQSGWDWFSLQFNDGTELMLFRLRRKDGTEDPFSAGTYIDAAGRKRNLTSMDFDLTPGQTWRSSETGGVYPVEWRVRVPTLGIDVNVRTPFPGQELALKGGNTAAYWEGAMDATGTRTGVGYLEMTGYAGAVQM